MLWGPAPNAVISTAHAPERPRKAMGLKLDVHVMRGVLRAAVARHSPGLG